MCKIVPMSYVIRFYILLWKIKNSIKKTPLTLTSLLISAPASSSICTMASSPRTQAYMSGVIPCERRSVSGGHQHDSDSTLLPKRQKYLVKCAAPAPAGQRR